MPPNKLRNLYQDPDFIKLSYPAQTEVRTALLQQYLPQDEGFLQLPPQAQMQVMEQLTFAPPALEDPTMTQLVGAAGQKAQEGDRDALEQMSGFIIRRSLYTQSILANLIDKRLIAPMLQDKFGDPMEMDELKNYAIMNMPGKEEAKVADYFNYLLSQDAQLAKKTKAWSTVAAIGGNLVEVAAMYMTGIGAAPATAKGLGKLFIMPFAKAAAAATSSAKIQLLRVGMSISHAAAGGVAGVARETLKDVLNESITDANFQEVASNAKTYFGDYFIWDLISNITFSVVAPMLKASVKNFKGWGQHGKTLKGPLDEKQMDTIIRKLVTMQDIDDTMLAGLPQQMKDGIRSKQQALAIFDKVNKTDLRGSSDEALHLAAELYHFSAKKTATGWKLWHNFDDAIQPATIKGGTREAQEWLWKEIVAQNNRMSFSVGGPKDAFIRGVGTDKLRVRQIITQKADTRMLKNTDILADLIAPTEKGKFSAKGIQEFSKAYAGAAGTNPSRLRVVARGQSFFLQNGDEVLAEVPKAFQSAASEVRNVETVIEALNKFIDTSMTTAGSKPLANFKPLRQGEYLQAVKNRDLYTPAWLNHVATKQLQGQVKKTVPGKGYDFISKKGSLHFDSLDDLGDFVMSKLVDFETVKYHLDINEGLKLIKHTDGGFTVTGLGQKPVWKGQSLEEFVLQFPELAPKAPGHLGPKLTLISPTEVEIRYVGETAVGPMSKMMKHLDRFQPSKQPKRVQVGREGAYISVSDWGVGKKGKQFLEVYIPEVNYRMPVQTVKEARSFIDDGFKHYTNLKRIAMEKGYRLNLEAGDYVLYNAKNEVFRAKNTEELFKVLKEVPIPEYAAELTGLADDLISAELRLPESGWKVEPWEAMSEGTGKVAALRSSLRDLSAWWKPKESFLVDIANYGGDRQVVKYFRQMEDARRIVAGRRRNMGLATFTLWDRIGLGADDAKNVSRRVMLGNMLESPVDKWDDLFKSLNASDAEQTAVHQLRRLWGRTADEGLFAQFNLDPSDFIHTYRPHMRKALLQNPDLIDKAADSVSLIKSAYGGHAPKQLEAFFKKLRKSDVVDMMMEEDPIKLMLRYAELGNRDLFIGPIMEETMDYMRLNAGKVGEPMLRQMQWYMDEIMGVKTVSENTMAEATRAFMRKMGLADSEAKDIVSSAMSLGYASTMGFRAWLPLRNQFQIWTTLAPLTQNHNVVKGLQRVLRDTDGKLFDALRRRGLITSDLPLFAGRELFSDEKLLSRITHKALKWYKNSDDFTRAVGWASAQSRFMDGVDRLNRGVLKNADQFADVAGLNAVTPDIKQQVMEFMGQKQVQAAADTYANYIVETAFFPYRSGMNPAAFRGVVGKMFGMFGHYPTFYVDNIRKVMKYGKLSDKIAFGATFVANSTLIYQTFRQFGVEGKNFQFWNPMFFAGGPFYQLMNKAMEVPLMFKGDYRGRQAASEVLGMSMQDGKLVWQPQKSEFAKLLVPGSFAFRAIGNSIEHWNKGDYYNWFLSLTSAPLVNPDQQPSGLLPETSQALGESLGGTAARGLSGVLQ